MVRFGIVYTFTLYQSIYWTLLIYIKFIGHGDHYLIFTWTEVSIVYHYRYVDAILPWNNVDILFLIWFVVFHLRHWFSLFTLNISIMTLHTLQLVLWLINQSDDVFRCYEISYHLCNGWDVGWFFQLDKIRTVLL